MNQILIVDDEINMCNMLQYILEEDGYYVLTRRTGKDALDILNSDTAVDLVIADLKLHDMSGIDILNQIQESEKEVPLVLITAYGTIELAVEAMKNGAVDFITKPFSKDVILHVTRRTLRAQKLEKENRYLKDVVLKKDLVYKSLEMASIMETVKKVAQVETPVLIVGESGVGKEFIARAIHNLSDEGSEDSAGKPFIPVHCPTIPESLFESELFGYQKGTFTGAAQDYIGLLRLSEGGTLFLDEIGDLPLNIQPKLLRFLEQKTFKPLGKTHQVTVNTRIVCATNRDIKAMVENRQFREDLYYRINTITIEVPPLTKRKDDILPITEYFLEKMCKKIGKERKQLSDELKTAFLAYAWPGNVRELRNIIERAVVLSGDTVISLETMPNELELQEKELLSRALEKNKWNISSTAKALGVTRGTLRYRMNKYGLHPMA